MFEVIEYNLKFTYVLENKLKWFDDFKCDKEWLVIRIKDIKNIQKSYKDKTPNIDTKNKYEIALYRKNKWHILYQNKGDTIRCNNEPINITGLEITSMELIPIFIIFKFDYDFQTLLTIIQRNENAQIIENNKLSIVECKVMYKQLEIYINGKILSYRGKYIESFKEICKEIKNSYEEENKPILDIMNKMDKEVYNPKTTHKAIAYKTWYNAKRENQREWPFISTEKRKNSIEFPIGSNIYYYYPGKYIGLAERNDINDEKYIPKIYNRNHLENKNSLLYKYYNNIPLSSKVTKVKKYENNIEDYKVQILDKYNKRLMVLTKENKWIKSMGNKIANVIALPYNYKQIVHDYCKLGRLKIGPIMDLTHIGIVDIKGNEVITFPELELLYINKCLETHRLMTFKIIEDNEIKVLYDK